MTDIYYPHEYLPLPLQDGYGFKSVDNLLRTEMVTGLARQRRRFVSTPASVSVKWILTSDAQFMVHDEIKNSGWHWVLQKPVYCSL